MKAFTKEEKDRLLTMFKQALESNDSETFFAIIEGIISNFIVK